MKASYLLLLLVLRHPVLADTNTIVLNQSCNEAEFQEYPQWCSFMQVAVMDTSTFLQLSNEFSKNAGFMARLIQTRQPRSSSSSSFIADHRFLRMASKNNTCQNSSLPIVLTHGMGDSCFNDGMISIVHLVAQWTGRYTVCIPMGPNQQEDTSAGYFLNMEASVDKLAAIIQLDSNMKQGFHAIGLSQGNNIIRGYITKYNNPPVHTFIAINGVNAGVGAVPYCIRKDSITEESFYIKESVICRALMEVASEKAYTAFAQQHSFQANYWRDPRQEYWNKYLEYSQLAYYNNERSIKNNTLNDNFGKTKKFVWIMAEQDEMVWPKEVCFHCALPIPLWACRNSMHFFPDLKGEQWGAPDPMDPFNKVLQRNQTLWYIQDYFGLKSAEESGKNFFESFDGGHLQFSVDELKNWVIKYIICM